MSLALVYSRASFGINAPLVTVEVHLSNGLPSISIVGLASAEVKESKERVRSAILNSGFEFPASRIIINLGPAVLPKSSGRFDLAIALGILIASEQLEKKWLKNFEVIGELSLNGELRPVSGILTATLCATAIDKDILIPTMNAEEAGLSGENNIYCANNLLQISRGLADKKLLKFKASISNKTDVIDAIDIPDISEIKGNQHAKRALLIAAAGAHNMLFAVSPGSGKTMLARCLPGILDELTLQEAKEIAAVESITTEGFSKSNWLKRRFRAPHHNCSMASITGGGRLPVPGEISLAHKGILFFDELPEYPRSVLESLRQPLEDGHLTISRTEWKVDFPAEFQFIAAMNPCPCGYFASKDRECHCSKVQILNYLGKISGPLLDRIDIQVMVNNPKISLIDSSKDNSYNSNYYREKIVQCRKTQYQRQGVYNSRLPASKLLSISQLDKNSITIFNKAIKHYQLSIRAQQKILRVARTIADLELNEAISEDAIVEALSFRSLELLMKKARSYI